VRRTAVLVLAALAATAGLMSIAPPAGATADATLSMPLTHFTDLVVDDAHGHVFLSGGGTDGIVVRNLEGATVTTIPNEPGATQMALSYDSSTLYVALVGAGAIAAIDTGTLTETTRYSVGAICPTSVAFASGKVWFGYGCDQWGSNVGVVDPSTDPPTVTLGLLASNTDYPPEVLASAAKPGLLVVADVGSSPGLLQLVDVSTGTAVFGASRQDTSPGPDVALTADGSRLIMTYGAVFLTSDLTADGSYTGPYDSSIGFAAGPGGLVAESVLGWYTPDITVFRADRTVVRSYETGGCCSQGQSGSVPRAGLAFSGDGTHLFAVTTDYLGNTVQLRVLHDPGKAPATIALTKPTSAVINHAFSLTGHLTSTLAIPVGAVITVKRDSTYGTVNLPSRTTASGGAFTITDTLTKRGAYGYRASWAGDATHAATTTRVTFAVSGLTTAVSILNGAGPYGYGSRPLVVAHLGTSKLRALRIYATPYGGSKTLIRSGTVDSHGNLSVYYTMTRRTTFTVAFAGDDTYNPVYSSKALLGYAKVSSAMLGYYATSGSYKLVHTSVDPSLYVSVAPNNAGACVSYAVQRYYSGAWHTVATDSCEYLDSTSHGVATYYTNVPAGTRFRLRATFNGDTRNVKTYGAWVYGKFTT
jgi:hypothetical protein